MPEPRWVVKTARPRTDYTLLLTFADGKVGVYDAHEFLTDSLFAKLKNPAFFMKARVMYDSVIWDEDTDIAPEYLYKKSVPVR